MTWQEFAHQELALAVLGQERLERYGLVLIGTLRKNGWQQISPVEPLFANGQLHLGMMWRSHKALDLFRDPRCTIHNAVSDRNGTDCKFKIYGRAFDVANPGERRSYLKALFEKIGFQSGGQEFH